MILLAHACKIDKILIWARNTSRGVGIVCGLYAGGSWIVFWYIHQIFVFYSNIGMLVYTFYRTLKMRLCRTRKGSFCIACMVFVVLSNNYFLYGFLEWCWRKNEFWKRGNDQNIGVIFPGFMKIHDDESLILQNYIYFLGLMNRFQAFWVGIVCITKSSFSRGYMVLVWWLECENIGYDYNLIIMVW